MKFTCTLNGCSACTGTGSALCHLFQVTVSIEGSVSELPRISDCKNGNTVTQKRIDGGAFAVFEIAIIGKRGNSL